MKVFKDRSFLVFELDNGKQCRYDFKTRKAYGFSGKEVKNIKSQLSGVEWPQVYENCVDEGYGNFLCDVGRWTKCSNIGTILEKIPQYSVLEPLYSAGVKVRIRENILDWRQRGIFEHVPIGLIRIFRDHGIPIEDVLVDRYIENPDGFNVAFSMSFISLTDKDVVKCFKHGWTVSTVNNLVKNYGYTTKNLFNYIDRIVTYEAISANEVLNFLSDTIRMCAAISTKYDRFPRYLKTTHDIVTRNYNRLHETFSEEMFAKRVKKNMDHRIGDYLFIYPNNPQDIKDEAVQQHNCVASYIQRVIDGNCDILFMRKANEPEKALVTLEVVNGKAVQARQRYNDDVTEEQKEAIAKYEAWLRKEGTA